MRTLQIDLQETIIGGLGKRLEPTPEPTKVYGHQEGEKLRPGLTRGVDGKFIYDPAKDVKPPAPKEVPQ